MAEHSGRPNSLLEALGRKTPIGKPLSQALDEANAGSDIAKPYFSVQPDTAQTQPLYNPKGPLGKRIQEQIDKARAAGQSGQWGQGSLPLKDTTHRT